MMNPLDPQGVSFQMIVPEKFCQITYIPSLDVDQTQPSFMLRKADCLRGHHNWFIARDIARPQKISTDAGNVIDDSGREREDGKPK